MAKSLKELKGINNNKDPRLEHRGQNCKECKCCINCDKLMSKECECFKPGSPECSVCNNCPYKNNHYYGR